MVATNVFPAKKKAKWILFPAEKLSGDKNIFMGTYLETEQDFKTISEQGINTILNVQTNGDLEYRLLDINVLIL